MANSNLDDLTEALNKAQLSQSGLSFAGQGLKLNCAEDAKEIIEKIKEIPVLNYLNLEGNTLGIEAAQSISVALETRKEFKRALWKDLFTGRMKDEIPVALEHLGAGLVKSTARLVELDLSDNAFGPIGVKGLASLLKSSCCFALEELRLNNNGLGISGAKILSKALIDCYNFSRESGKPLPLRVFIAGRNRLENEGATLLAEFFKMVGTLEEVQMPQNGIYHKGITALSEAFNENERLEIINLNDNTIGPIGAKALSNILPKLTRLRVVNFGDCLLKTKGAINLAYGLESCDGLEELVLDANEIKIDGARLILNAVCDKNLTSLSLNGNCFGEDGVEEIKSTLIVSGKPDILGSLSEDEGDDDDEEESEEDRDDYDEDVEEEEEEDEDEDDYWEYDGDNLAENKFSTINVEFDGDVTVENFLRNVSLDGFLALGDNRLKLLLESAKSGGENPMEKFMEVVIKVSSINIRPEETSGGLVLSCCKELFRELFAFVKMSNNFPVLNNCLLIYLGLIKSENKKFKPSWNIENCFLTIQNVLEESFFHSTTKDTLKLFVQRDVENQKEPLEAKKRLLTYLP